MDIYVKKELNEIKAPEALVNRTRALMVRQAAASVSVTGTQPVGGFRFRFAALCLVVLVMTGAVAATALCQMPVNYIGLDVNPSLELQLNYLNRVVRVVSYNEDGTKILNEDYRWMPADVAVNRIVSRIVELGYITDEEEGLVMVSLYDGNRRDGDAVMAMVASAVEQAAFKEKLNIRVTEGRYSDVDRIKAKAYQISPGKYNLIDAIVTEEAESDQEGALEQYAKTSVSRLMIRQQEMNRLVPEEEAETVVSDTDDSSGNEVEGSLIQLQNQNQSRQQNMLQYYIQNAEPPANDSSDSDEPLQEQTRQQERLKEYEQIEQKEEIQIQEQTQEKDQNQVREQSQDAQQNQAMEQEMVQDSDVPQGEGQETEANQAQTQDQNQEQTQPRTGDSEGGQPQDGGQEFPGDSGNPNNSGSGEPSGNAGESGGGDGGGSGDSGGGQGGSSK